MVRPHLTRSSSACTHSHARICDSGKALQSLKSMATLHAITSAPYDMYSSFFYLIFKHLFRAFLLTVMHSQLSAHHMQGLRGWMGKESACRPNSLTLGSGEISLLNTSPSTYVFHIHASVGRETMRTLFFSSCRVLMNSLRPTLFVMGCADFIERCRLGLTIFMTADSMVSTNLYWTLVASFIP